jgi:hypothetical protein
VNKEVLKSPNYAEETTFPADLTTYCAKGTFNRTPAVSGAPEEGRLLTETEAEAAYGFRL